MITFGKTRRILSAAAGVWLAATTLGCTPSPTWEPVVEIEATSIESHDAEGYRITRYHVERLERRR